MIVIKEEVDLSVLKTANNAFDCGFAEGDRAFVMRESDEIIGFAVISLVKTYVLIKDIKVKDGLPFGYYDLLTRSVLAVLRDFDPITVKINKTDAYYKGFGFTQSDDGMEVITTDINLKGSCGH